LRGSQDHRRIRFNSECWELTERLEGMVLVVREGEREREWIASSRLTSPGQSIRAKSARPPPPPLIWSLDLLAFPIPFLCLHFDDCRRQLLLLWSHRDGTSLITSGPNVIHYMCELLVVFPSSFWRTYLRLLTYACKSAREKGRKLERTLLLPPSPPLPWRDYAIGLFMSNFTLAKNA
jgi:hypothetical protein